MDRTKEQIEKAYTKWRLTDNMLELAMVVMLANDLLKSEEFPLQEFTLNEFRRKNRRLTSK
jgi:hypothetical protein